LLLTDLLYTLGQLFSDLASKNCELLASLASVLRNISTPLGKGLIDFVLLTDPELNSLQKVKEMLRRLRWQRERLHGRSAADSQEQAPLFGADSYRIRPPAFTLGPWATEMARFVACEQKGGRLEDVDTVELAKAMMVQQERAEVRL
jgi:hypothetical protein